MTMAIHYKFLGPFKLSPAGAVFRCGFVMGLLKADHHAASLTRLVIAILASVLLHLSVLNWNDTDYTVIDSVANLEKITISFHAINPSVAEKSSSNDPRPVQTSKAAKALSAAAELPESKRVPKSARQRHSRPLLNGTTKKWNPVQSEKSINRTKPVTVGQSERIKTLASAEPVHIPPEQRLRSKLLSPPKQVRLAPRHLEYPSRETQAITRKNTGPPKTTTASSSLVQPEIPLIRNPRFRRPPRPPVYPRQAIRHGQEGTVTLYAKIASEGTVQQINLFRSSGFALLDQAATTAVRKWAFEPAIHNGFPMDAWVEVPVNFILKQSTRSQP